MLQRKRKTLDPCPTCRLHRARCICELIPKIMLSTRVNLIIHAKEIKRTTNTGMLAHHALVNSTLNIRGEGRERLDLSPLLTPDYESYVLYPSEDAIDVETLKPDKPIQLFVSDGNWRQAAKLNTRHPELAHLPRVKIRPRGRAEHNLRKEHFPEGLSTLESIAIALAAIEGETAVESLMNLYQAKLYATLESRGINRIRS